MIRRIEKTRRNFGFSSCGTASESGFDYDYPFSRNCGFCQMQAEGTDWGSGWSSGLLLEDRRNRLWCCLCKCINTSGQLSEHVCVACPLQPLPPTQRHEQFNCLRITVAYLGFKLPFPNIMGYTQSCVYTEQSFLCGQHGIIWFLFWI